MTKHRAKDGPMRRLHRGWGVFKVGTRRHRLWVMTGTIVALWTLFGLHLAGLLTLSAGSDFLIVALGKQYPGLRPFIAVFAGVLALFLAIEWRGIMNAVGADHAPLGHIEKRQAYITHRHQALATILLTLSLFLFVLQMAGSRAETAPEVVPFQPAAETTQIASNRVLARPRSAGTVRVERLPSTLRRKITRYTYVEHRQWQIAADPPPGGSFSISGIVYAGEGTSPFSAGTTIALSHNGSDVATTTTGAGGQYTFSSVHMTGGTILTLFIDGSASKAVTVTLASGGSMTGVHLYENHLIVRSDSGSVALTNAHLAVADNSGDTDISAVYTINSGILNVKSGRSLTVWRDDTFTPGNAVNVGGGITINGTLAPEANSVTLSGAWLKANGGGFLAGTSMVRMDGGNQSLSGSTAFYDFMKTVTGAYTLTFAAGTTQQFNGTMTLNGISGGRLSLRSSIDGTRAFIRPVNTPTVSYLDVKDNHNLDADAIGCFTECVDSGNNIQWLFGSNAPGSPGGPLSPLNSNDFRLRPDVVDSGGNDWSKSTNYRLSDSIGEAVIGHGAASEYTLNSGYRQPSASDIISVSCSSNVPLGSVIGSGQRTGSGTCVVLTDAFNGYQLGWRIHAGSGGTLTGYLISQFEDGIGPFTPSVANVPDTWNVNSADAEWGGRVRSNSTDTAAEWGVDGVSEKWLNVGTGSTRVISSRNSATPVSGSVQIIQFRSEIGAGHLQPNGEYRATVTFTVVGL